jgi:hypothetical protein
MARMHEANLDALRSARALFRARWDFLLRAQPVHSPMGHPDTLTHLMDWTLDDIFDRLRKGRLPTTIHSDPSNFPPQPANYCPCGANPLLNYFICLRRAFLEWVEHESFPLLGLSPQERDGCVFEFLYTLETVAEREIQSFCAVCQQRKTKELCNMSSGLVGASGMLGRHQNSAVECSSRALS